MKKNTFLKILSVIAVTALPYSVKAASLTLLDSSFNEMVAYFSSLTDNIYIQEFKTSQTFSINRDDISDKQQIHELLVELVAGAGGVVEHLGNSVYKISTKIQQPKLDDSSNIEGRVIKRVELYEKIGIAGIKTLINAEEKLKNLKIIEEAKDAKSLLVYGFPNQLQNLQVLVDSLPAQKEEKKESIRKGEPVLNQLAEKGKAPEYVTSVIDLNYADTNELTENLRSVLTTEIYSISIAPHVSANQIIVSGLKSDVSTVIQLLKELDRAPRQVYLDAIIAEVSEETAAKLGLQFSVNSDNLAASSVTGVTGVNIGAAAGDPFLAGATGGILAVGRGANLVPDIGLMLAALEGDADNRILATPSIMATENKESTILVGQNVPFITGRYTSSNGEGTAPFQTIKREDIGTSLKLKPKIGSNGAIVMEIWQEVSRIDQSAPGLSDVVTVKRQISTVVSAMEGETIAIGGLKIEQQELGVTKVPLLGDLPIIGNAFRQESTNTVNRNLAIFLRPRLVSEPNQRKGIYDVWQRSLATDFTNDLKGKSNFFKLEKLNEGSEALTDIKR